jgi:hypothetical protein
MEKKHPHHLYPHRVIFSSFFLLSIDEVSGKGAVRICFMAQFQFPGVKSDFKYSYTNKAAFFLFT